MIRSNRIPTIGRRLAVAGAAVVTLAVAACSDAATAPQTTAARDADGASAVIFKVSAKVKVRIVDTASVTLKETGWVEFTSANADTVRIRDNSDKDLDPGVGVMEVQMATATSYTLPGNVTYTMGYPNSYTWCEASAPAKHKLTSQKCGNFEAKWGSKMTVTLWHEQQVF